jgi:hypothetical protein
MALCLSIVLLLSQSTFAQVCGIPTLSAQCPTFTSLNVCTPDTRTLNYERSGYQGYCDLAPPSAPGTALQDPPYPTFDSMYDACQGFCGSTPVPVVVGSAGFGVDLESAASVCLDPNLLGSPYDRSRHDRCTENATALSLMSDATAGFLAELRIFSYAVLNYKANTLNHMEAIKQRLQSQETVRAITAAERSEKAETIRAIYADLVSTSPGTTILKQASESLSRSAVNMNIIVQEQLTTFRHFTEQCNLYFPKTPAFLSDMCTKSGNECPEVDTAEHVSCCCLVNPIATVNEFDASAPPPSPTTASTATDHGINRRRNAVVGDGATDVCAQAFLQSEPSVKTTIATIESYPQQQSLPAAQRLPQTYAADLRSKYPEYYSSITEYYSELSSGNPCFPSQATVILESGRTVPMTYLSTGDRILAARNDGTLYHDTVSRFSLAQPNVSAAFVSLQTDGGLGHKELSLTETHHLPVGQSMTIKPASEVEIGETVWVVADVSLPLAPQKVTSINIIVADGLHNPLLVHGGMPIVDGVATSFNVQPIVTFDSYAVPIVEALCVATDTCDFMRKVIVAIECAAKHAVHINPTCKTFHYIDGIIMGSATAVDVATLAAGTLAVAAATAWSLHTRK